MAHSNHHHLRQLLAAGIGEEASETAEYDTNLSSTLYQSQDDSVEIPSASLMTASNSLQDLVSLTDGDSASWFNALQSNEFDFGSALLSQDQEQFGLGNIVMDDFTDQVLKSSASGNEQDSWIEANLSDHLSSNSDLSLNPGNQSDQLAESLGTTSVQQSSDMSPQRYCGAPSFSYDCDLAATGQLPQNSMPQQSPKSPLSVANNLRPSVPLNRYHSLPQGAYTDNEYYLDEARANTRPLPTAPISTGSMPTHCHLSPTGQRLAEDVSASYPPLSERLTSPAGSHGSACLVRIAYSTSASTTSDSVYAVQPREDSNQLPLHPIFDSNSYGEPPQITLTSPNPPDNHFNPSIHQTQHFHNGQGMTSSNQLQPINLQTSHLSNEQLAGSDHSLSPQRAVIPDEVSMTNIRFPSVELGWQNANRWQAPGMENRLTASNQFLSFGQSPRGDYPVATSSYSSQEVLVGNNPNIVSNENRQGGYIANQMTSNNQFMTQPPGTSMSGEGTSIDADPSKPLRRQKTEQSLRDCGLFEATMLTKRLVARDQEIQTEMEDFKCQLAQLMKSLAVADT